ARTFRQPTAFFVKRMLADPASAGSQQYTRVLALRGGLPIKVGEDSVGAVGTRSRVNGTVVTRAPTASYTALASAAGTVVAEASPAPSGGSSGRLTSSITISGASGNRNIG